MPQITSNPLLLILENIVSDVHPSLPKPSSPFAHFVKTNQCDLAPVIARRWNESQNSERNDSTSQDRSTIPGDEFCTQIAMEKFCALSEADRDSIRDVVNKEYVSALQKYNEAMRRIYPVIAHDRSVDAVSDLLQPIFSGLEVMTGLNFVAWGGGLIQHGLGILNVSSRAPLCDGPSEHLMTFPKSQADNFAQAALNWMHSVHSNFIYDSRCTALESAESSRAPRIFTPQSAEPPRDPEDFTNRAEYPPPESPQSAPTLMDSIAWEDPEGLASGVEHPTPEPIPPDTVETVNIHLSIKRRISDEGEDADGGDENQQNSKKMRFNSESPQSVPQSNVSEYASQGKATPSRAAQVLTDVAGRESVPPIITLPQDVTPRRHSFSQTSQLPPKKRSGTAKVGHGRTSLPTSASTKPSEIPADFAETLAGAIKKLLTRDKGFLQGLGSIMKVELGPAYKQLLICLVRLEITWSPRGKAKEKFLDRTFRPKEIKEWIHQGRGRNNRNLIISNASEFADQWWAWWTILQPKWRTKGKNGRPLAAIPDANEDWSCLHVSGGNGLICVVAGLYWWGRKVKETKANTRANKESWNKAVDDCLWALQRIMVSVKKEALSSSPVVGDEDLGDAVTDDPHTQSEGDELESSDED